MDELKKQNNQYSQFKQYDIYTDKFQDIKKQLLRRNADKADLLRPVDISDVQNKDIDIKKVKFLGNYEGDEDTV